MEKGIDVIDDVFDSVKDLEYISTQLSYMSKFAQFSYDIKTRTYMKCFKYEGVAYNNCLVECANKAYEEVLAQEKEMSEIKNGN